MILYEIEKVSLEEYLLISSLLYDCMTGKYAEKDRTQGPQNWANKNDDEARRRKKSDER